MAEIDQLVLPIKKRRHTLAFSPPKKEENLPCPVPVFSSFAQNSGSINNAHFARPRPAKRLCTENRNLELKTEKETTDYLWGLFDYIRADFWVESEEENQSSVFGALPFENNFDVKAGLEKEDKKKKKPWWKSMVSRGCDKLRKEKMRLRKANVKDLFSHFWNREQEFQWKIEHKQDPYALLSNPVSQSLIEF